MAAPALWLISDASANSNGERYIAKDWDTALPADAAAAGARQARQAPPTIM